MFLTIFDIAVMASIVCRECPPNTHLHIREKLRTYAHLYNVTCAHTYLFAYHTIFSLPLPRLSIRLTVCLLQLLLHARGKGGSVAQWYICVCSHSRCLYLCTIATPSSNQQPHIMHHHLLIRPTSSRWGEKSVWELGTSTRNKPQEHLGNSTDGHFRDSEFGCRL